MCLPNIFKDNHKCIEDVSRKDCPICLEDIHRSREKSRVPVCGHLFHMTCFEKLIDSGHYNCPVCVHSFVNSCLPEKGCKVCEYKEAREVRL